jgi:hypothetical protein
MANAIHVIDKEGKEHVIMTSRIKGVEAVPAVPEEPPVQAADAVEDDPGEEATATSPGRPPVKGHPKTEAKAGKRGVPAGAIIHGEDGDVEVGLNTANVLSLINS